MISTLVHYFFKCSAITRIYNIIMPGGPPVQAADKLGNKVTRGGDKFRAKVTDPSGGLVDTDVKDRKANLYNSINLTIPIAVSCLNKKKSRHQIV